METTEELERTERSRVVRRRERGRYDRETIHRILDATPLCHVAYVIDGAPFATPTFHWRVGDRVYWHGSSASRALRAAEGVEVCLTVTLLDGLVLARSAFHHSANYRSVMAFGTARKVESEEERTELLRAFVERLCPGRWDALRPVKPQEVKATTLLSLPIHEASAKVRDGQPVDDEADYAWPVWAGVLPVRSALDEPVPDPRNLPGLTAPAALPSLRRS